MGPTIFQVRAWPSVLDGMPFTEFPLLAWGAVKLELSSLLLGKHVSERALEINHDIHVILKANSYICIK